MARKSYGNTIKYEKRTGYVQGNTVRKLQVAEPYSNDPTSIEELAEEGPCIIMGRCAGYLMRNREEAFSVFVHADMETRIERVKERDHITSRMKAKRKIQDVDEKRSAFRKDYTGQEWGMSKNYDLSVSTTELSYEQAADLILDYKKMTEESDRA